MTVIQQKFTHNRGLATGLALLGFTAGTVLAPMLFNYLLNTYGLFGSLLLQAGIYAHSFIFIWAFQSPKCYMQSISRSYQDKVAHNETSADVMHNESSDDVFQNKTSEKVTQNTSSHSTIESEPSDKVIHIHSSDSEMNTSSNRSTWASFCGMLMDFSICRDVKYVLYVFVRLLWFFCRFCLGTHIVNAATLLGVGLTEARYLPSVIGISNLVLRCFSTVVLNFRCLNKEVYFSLGIVCVTTACFLAASAKDYAYLVAAMVMVGCNEGQCFIMIKY